MELSYDLLTENALTGTAGVQVTNARLADTAGTGTVTIASAGSRAVYDDTHTVHGNSMVRISSGHHRQETPKLRVALPSSGLWCARWYSWVPHLQTAGHGTSEVRSTAVWPNKSYVIHETTTPGSGPDSTRTTWLRLL